MKNSNRWKNRTLSTLRHSFKLTKTNTPVFEMVESWFSSGRTWCWRVTWQLESWCQGTESRGIARQDQTSEQRQEKVSESSCPLAWRSYSQRKVLQGFWGLFGRLYVFGGLGVWDSERYNRREPPLVQVQDRQERRIQSIPASNVFIVRNGL